jgi:hypothetical protein
MVQQGWMQMAGWMMMMMIVLAAAAAGSPTLRVQHAQVIVAPTTNATSRQVGAALVYHPGTNTAIVAFQDGPCRTSDTAARVRVRRVPGTGTDVLQAEEVGGAGQCYGQPLLAMSADGERIVLAVPVVGAHTLLYETQDQGRTWTALAQIRGGGDRPLVLQHIATSQHEFVLVMQTASDTVTLYRVPVGTRMGSLTTTAGAPISSATLVQCNADGLWRMVVRRGAQHDEGLYTSLTAGRTWNPLPSPVPSPATPLPLSMFLYDRARQPPGFDALAFSDREGTQPTGPLPLADEEAQAWHNLAIRRTWCECAADTATLSNGWRLGVSPATTAEANYTLVDGRTCRLAAAGADATNVATIDRCLPDGTRLSTGVLRVAPWRSAPTLGRPSPFPTRVVALVNHSGGGGGRWPTLLLERDVTPLGADDFLVDLVLSIPTSSAAAATSWTEVVLGHAMPMRLLPGYYATGDYERALSWHPRNGGGGEYVIAYSQAGRIALSRVIVTIA